MGNTRPLYSKPDINSSKITKPPTRKERDERRKKGLCMWCGQKFTYGHSCIQSQLYHILVEDTGKREGDTEEFLDCVDNMEEMGQKEDVDDHHPTISLHALLGTEGCQTMLVIGKIKKQSLVFLIDSDSTHNFMD